MGATHGCRLPVLDGVAGMSMRDAGRQESAEKPATGMKKPLPSHGAAAFRLRH